MPTACRKCGHSLSGAGPEPLRHKWSNPPRRSGRRFRSANSRKMFVAEVVRTQRACTEVSRLRLRVEYLLPLALRYQLHRLICPHCRTSHVRCLARGRAGSLWPPFRGTLAVLAGGDRQSLRAVQVLADTLWNLVLSTGMIRKLRQQTAEALQQPYEKSTSTFKTRSEY